MSAPDMEFPASGGPGLERDVPWPEPDGGAETPVAVAPRLVYRDRVTLVAAAVAYAGHNWRVFPLKPRAKEPLTAHGFHDATADVAQIERWWTETPDANIGLHPGPSGLVVFDVDGPAGREAAIARGLFSEPTLAVLTGREGGVHLYYKHPGFPVSSRPLGPHLDVRCDQGYTVLPPSVHPSGAVYKWDKAPVLELPPDVVALLRNGSAPPTAAAPLPAGAPIPEGTRNTTLTSLAGTMRRRGMEAGEIAAALHAVNRARCVPPYPDDEIEKIARSVSRYAPAPTRTERHTTGEAEPEPEMIARPLETEISAQPFAPPLLADFAAQVPPQAEWVLHGYAARESVTVVGGHPKAGKSTLLAEAVGAVSDAAPFLGHPTLRGAALWVDLEQPRGVTARLLLAHCSPTAPVYVQWGALPGFAPMREFCERAQVVLVVVDSLARVFELAGVEDENDAAQVGRALQPVLEFARTSHVALVLIHHLRKSGGSEGLDLRGSGALAAAVDVLVSFRRYTPDAEETDARRVLQAYSRYEETPAKVVIERVDRRYRVCGTPGEVKRRTERETVLTVLTADPQTAEEVATTANMAPSAARTVLKLLAGEPEDTRAVARCGTGKRGDAFRYSKCLRAEKSSVGAQSIRHQETDQNQATAGVQDPEERYGL